MILTIIVILKATYSYKYKERFLKFVCLFNVWSSVFFFHLSVYIVIAIFLVKKSFRTKQNKTIQLKSTQIDIRQINEEKKAIP